MYDKLHGQSLTSDRSGGESTDARWRACGGDIILVSKCPRLGRGLGLAIPHTHATRPGVEPESLLGPRIVPKDEVRVDSLPLPGSSWSQGTRAASKDGRRRRVYDSRFL